MLVYLAYLSITTFVSLKFAQMSITIIHVSLIPGTILSTSLLHGNFDGLRAGDFHLLVSQCSDSFRLKRKHLGWIGFRFLVPQGKKKPFLGNVLILESVLDLL